MTKKAFIELLRRELPDMEDKLSPWRPWSNKQQQIAITACRVLLGGKVGEGQGMD